MRTLYFISILALLVSCASKPAPVAAPPPDPKADPKWTALKEKIAKIQEGSQIPALQGIIAERHDTVFFYSNGVRALGQDTPIKETDKFHLGTGAKVMTAVMIGQLIDQKLISWDTPLRDLIGKDMKMNSSLGHITIEMLLSNRSGLIDVKKLKVWPTLSDGRYSTKRARALLVESILSYNPQFTPDSMTDNGNSGYVVLSWILEKLTNFTYEDLAKNKLFIPLGLTSCGFGAPGSAKAEKPNQPWGHMIKGGQLTAIKPSPQADFPTAYASAGGIHCNADDWIKFLKEINLGVFRDSTFLTETTFQKMLGASRDPALTYGGFSRYERIWAGGMALASFGGNGMNYSMVTMAPGREIIFLVFTNSGAPDALKGAAQVLKLMTENYQDMKPAEDAKPPE